MNSPGFTSVSKAITKCKGALLVPGISSLHVLFCTVPFTFSLMHVCDTTIAASLQCFHHYMSATTPVAVPCHWCRLFATAICHLPKSYNRRPTLYLFSPWCTPTPSLLAVPLFLPSLINLTQSILFITSLLFSCLCLLRWLQLPFNGFRKLQNL